MKHDTEKEIGGQACYKAEENGRSPAMAAHKTAEKNEEEDRGSDKTHPLQEQGIKKNAKETDDYALFVGFGGPEPYRLCYHLPCLHDDKDGEDAQHQTGYKRVESCTGCR